MLPYFYPAVMPQYCPSVCPSVTFRYRDHICWNTSKVISLPNSDKIVMWRFLRNRRLLLCLHTILRALIYWAHRAVVLAIAWHLVVYYFCTVVEYVVTVFYHAFNCNGYASFCGLFFKHRITYYTLHWLFCFFFFWSHLCWAVTPHYVVLCGMKLNVFCCIFCLFVCFYNFQPVFNNRSLHCRNYEWTGCWRWPRYWVRLS